jgi:aminopeptidase-like protein
MKNEQSVLERLVADDSGEELFSFVKEIYPICRSITGQGVRETLRAIGKRIELDIHEVPTGTPVFDWVIPREWNIRGGYIKNEHGETIVDFAQSNLHVMSYSVPVRQWLSLDELKKHIYTLPDQPDLIPYRTSYYADNWAFCMQHRLLESLKDGIYEVVIDSSLADGSLTYGEYLHRGERDSEILFSAHICHPSLANDNCSGIALLTQLAKRISNLKTRYSYRFVFAPGTIGAITWLARNESICHRIDGGLVLSMVGDGAGPTYKKSRRGDGKIDRALCHVLKHCGQAPTILEFSPYGYDERQYCSPGFNLPVGLLQRSRFGEIPEYHTSADNLDFVAPDHLAMSYRLVCEAIDVLENDNSYNSTIAKCEPQLGRRGLYGAIGGNKDAAEANMAMLWTLNLSDGKHSLLDIAERANLPFALVRKTAALLHSSGLLKYTGC